MSTIVTPFAQKRYIEELNQNFSIFWMSFFVFVLCRAVLSTYIVPFYVIAEGIQSIATVAMVYSCFQMIQFKVKNELLGILLVLYCAWCIFIIFNGFVYEYRFIKSLIFHGFLKYFFPLILFIPKTMRFYQHLINVIFYGSIGFIVLNILFFDLVTTQYDINVNEKFTFEGFVRNLGIPMGFVALTYIYHSKEKVAFCLFGLLMMLSIAIFRARRSIMVIALVHLLIFMVIYYIYSNRKLLVSLFFVLLTVIGISYAGVVYKEGRNFFAALEDRNTEDTRSGVEAAFYRDFEPVDWVFGRGINGKYWCPNIDIKDTVGYRYMIETDYLNIILRGGILHLAMLLLFMLPAMFNNLFRSNNLFSKVAGIWILLWILSLYPMNVFNFDINYILVWCCISIGYSPAFRGLSDEKLKLLFAEKM